MNTRNLTRRGTSQDGGVRGRPRGARRRAMPDPVAPEDIEMANAQDAAPEVAAPAAPVVRGRRRPMPENALVVPLAAAPDAPNPASAVAPEAQAPAPAVPAPAEGVPVTAPVAPNPVPVADPEAPNPAPAVAPEVQAPAPAVPAPPAEAPVAAPEAPSPASAPVENEEPMEIVDAVPETKNYHTFLTFSNNSPEISDFCIIVEGQRFYVDKRHLTRHSSVLGAMINSPSVQNATLVLDDVKEAYFHWFLELINGVYHSLKASNIVQVLELVTRWKARYAKWACGDCLCRRCPEIPIKTRLELSVEHELNSAKPVLVNRIRTVGTLEEMRDSEIIFSDPAVLGLLFNKAMELAGAVRPPQPLHLRLQAAMDLAADQRGLVRPFGNRPQQHGINQNPRYNNPNLLRAPTPPRPRMPRMPTPPPPYHLPIDQDEMDRGRGYFSDSSRSPSPQRGRRRRHSSSMDTSESEYESESYSDDSRSPSPRPPAARRPRRYYSESSDYSMSPEPPRRRNRRDRYDHEERRGRRSRSPRR